jgi:hypothetical protein
MPITPLVAAVRHSDARIVRQLVSSGADVNERCEVEPVTLRRPEGSLYWTTALFEAVRQRNKEVAALLLARPDIDVNKTAVRRTPAAWRRGARAGGGRDSVVAAGERKREESNAAAPSLD